MSSSREDSACERNSIRVPFSYINNKQKRNIWRAQSQVTNYILVEKRRWEGICCYLIARPWAWPRAIGEAEGGCSAELEMREPVEKNKKWREIELEDKPPPLLWSPIVSATTLALYMLCRTKNKKCGAVWDLLISHLILKNTCVHVAIEECTCL